MHNIVNGSFLIYNYISDADNLSIAFSILAEKLEIMLFIVNNKRQLSMS